MRRIALHLCIAALCLATQGLHAETQATATTAAPPPPYQLVRTLQSLQNEAAAGNRVAHAAQGKLLGDLEHAMMAQAPEIWGDRKSVV